MPFTISHAAVVLPFARPLARWRLLSATIIGSMVPDFGLFLPWRPPRVATHSAVGLLTFCVPVGLATFWIFQRLLKTPLLAVLPDSAYARWRAAAEPAPIASLQQWLFAAVGVLIGAVTHLVWDAFTHEGARGIRMIPVLEDPTVDIAGYHLFGARLLQDVSSLIGLAAVLAIVAYGLRQSGAVAVVPPRSLEARERQLWIAGYAATAVLLAGFFFVIRHPGGVAGHYLALMPLGNFAVAMLRGFAAALVLVSLCLNARLRANR